MSTTPASPGVGTSHARRPDDEPAASDEFLALVARLRTLDVRLTAEGDALHYDAPDSTVTDDLLALLGKHKPELLSYLVAHAAEPQPESSGPVTFSQQRMYRQYHVSVVPASFHVAQRIELSGRLDVGALGRALTALVRRQTALRSRFAQYGEELVQEVVPLSPVRPGVTDLRGLPTAERGPAAQRWVTQHAETLFDLTRAPLLRAELLRTGAETWTFALVVHHIVVDGWGLGVLMSDLGALYRAALAAPGPHPPTDDEAGLAPLPVSLADVARWQRARLSGPRGEQLRSYWRTALAGAPMSVDLAYDRVRSGPGSDSGGQVTVRLARELTDGVEALARAQGTTAFTVLLTALGALLFRLTGQPEVVVSCNIANRIRQEHEPLVGMFVNSLAMRLRAADAEEAGVTGAIAAAARTFFSAADHQEYPISLVIADQADRIPADRPFPRVTMVMESQGVPVLTLPGLTARVHDVPLVGSRWDLCLVLTPDSDGIEMLLLYATDHFEAATAQRWAADYVDLLRGYLREELHGELHGELGEELGEAGPSARS